MFTDRTLINRTYFHLAVYNGLVHIGVYVFQIALFCLVAVSVVCGRPQYPGYPYGGVPGPNPHAAPLPVHDTPEVAAAKAAHFAAYNAAASAAAATPDHGAYPGAHGYAVPAPYSGAHGYGASYPGAPGYAAPYPGAPGYGAPYHGAPAIVNGVPADTPEVAAAKSAHFAAHAKASGNHYG